MLCQIQVENGLIDPLNDPVALWAFLFEHDLNGREGGIHTLTGFE